MKVFVLSPDANGQIDPTIKRNLIDFIPDQVCHPDSADVTLVPISLFPNYQFNEYLNEIKTPICVLDMMEYGTGLLSVGTHLFGKTHRSLVSDALGSHYARFDAWVGSRQPILYLKRELLKQDVSDAVKPIDWPCYLPIVKTQTKEEFDLREIQILNWWGYSHVTRPLLHADIFRGMVASNIHMLSDWADYPQLDIIGGKSNTWASIHVPWWRRKPIEEIVKWQERSKITVALPGNGQKCFRHSECVGSIMALHGNNLAWSFPWIHGENCILLHPGREFDCLEAALQRDDLYEIYLNCEVNLDRYRSARYVNEYILPALQSAL